MVFIYSDAPALVVLKFASVQAADAQAEVKTIM